MKRFILSFLIIMLSVMTLVSCKNGCRNTAPNTEKSSENTYFQTVDVAAFKEALQDSSLILLDVRTAEEHAEGCIPGTDYNFDILKDDFITQVQSTVNEGSSLAIYCRSGNRSKKAAKVLVENGYSVIELSTGYKGWIAAEQK